MYLLRSSLCLVESVNIKLGEVCPTGHLVVREEEDGPVKQHALQLLVLPLPDISRASSG